MSELAKALLAFAGTLVVATGAYLAVRLQRSGRIDTTEAATLWQAQESLRHDLVEELRAREAIIIELRERLATQQREYDATIKALRARIVDLERT